MTRPLVSVLTPSLNQGRWLAQNLLSVATQDYPNVEHIVMDGHSTDGSLQILERADPLRVRWSSEPDAGQSDALNKAYSLARGEIIGWLNSDDAYFCADAVSMAVAAFNRNPDADVVFGHAALVNADGLVLHVMRVPSSPRRWMRVHDFLVQPAVFVRRRALGDSMVDPAYDYMMDWELWLRLARSSKFVRVPRILAIDRHQPGRKGITRQDLRETDFARLRASYGIPVGPGPKVAVKTMKLANRLLGALHVDEVVGTRMAFDGTVESRASLLRRQLFVTRDRMPFKSSRS